jgi:hypothetical protein
MGLKITNEQKDKIAELYISGMTMQKVADEMNVCIATVNNVLKAKKVKSRPVKKLDKSASFALGQKYIGGESIASLSKQFRVSETQILQVYLPENGIFFRHDKRKTVIDDLFLNAPMKEEQFWFLGWMWADGYNNQKKGYLKITSHKKDFEVLQKFEKMIGGQIYHQEERNWADWYCTSKNLSETVASMGCVQAKSLTVEYPNIKVDNRIFIRGLFEGDGWASVRKGGIALDVGIASGSLKMLEQLGEIFTANGFPWKIYCRKNSNSKNIRISGANVNKVNFLKWIYKDANFFLKRKKEYFDNFLCHNPKFLV